MLGRLSIVLIYLIVLNQFIPYVSFRRARVDGKLQVYINEYYNLIHKYCKDPLRYNSSQMYNVAFGKFNKDDFTLAYCQQTINGYGIVVNEYRWNRLDEGDRKQLLFHEMSHCIIYKMHVEDKAHYMNALFYPIPEDIFIDQVVKDIRNRCENKQLKELQRIEKERHG